MEEVQISSNGVSADYFTQFNQVVMKVAMQGIEEAVTFIKKKPILKYEKIYTPEKYSFEAYHALVNDENSGVIEQLDSLADKINNSVRDHFGFFNKQTINAKRTDAFYTAICDVFDLINENGIFNEYSQRKEVIKDAFVSEMKKIYHWDKLKVV